MTNTLSSVNSGQLIKIENTASNTLHDDAAPQFSNLMPGIMATLMPQYQASHQVDPHPATSRQRRHASDNTTANMSHPAPATTLHNNHTKPTQLPNPLTNLVSAIINSSISFQKKLNQWKNEESQSHAKEWTLIANYDKTQSPSTAVVNAMVKAVQAVVADWRADGTFTNRVQKTVAYGQDRIKNYLIQAENDSDLKEDATVNDVHALGGEQNVRQDLQTMFMGNWENTQDPIVVLYMYEITERISAEHHTDSAVM